MSIFPSRRPQLTLGAMAIAWALCVPMAAQQDDSAIREHFLAAQRAQQQGRLDVAVAEYLAELHLQPGVPEVYANLGLVYYAQGKFGDSAQAFESAEKLKPGMRGVDLWLGVDDVKLDRPLEGVAHLRAAIRQDPTDKLAQSWLGTALWNAGKVDAALLQLRTAVARFPDDPDVLFATGEAYGKAVHQETENLLSDATGTALSDRIYAGVYASEHDWTKAEGHLRRAIERDPRSAEAHLELAEVFLAQARLRDAKEQLDEAMTIAPHSAAVLARSGEVLLLLQKPAEGLELIQRAMDIDGSTALDALGLPVEDNFDQPGGAGSGGQLALLCRETAAKLASNPASSPSRSAGIAALYAKAGDSGAAARAYRSIVTSSSNSRPDANPLARGLRAMHQHHYSEAEDALVRWLALHPGDRAARYDLILVRRNLFTEEITKLLAIAPDSYHVHQLLGQLYVDHEEDDKALTEYLAVAAARPDLPGVHFWLGHLYWKHGDADHALAELTRELEIDPGNPEANGELGAVLIAQDRAKEAIPHLEAAIRSKPDLWPAYAQLGRAYASEKSYARAEEAFKRALAHDPDGSTHYQFALVLHAEGKTAQAAQVFAQVRAIKNERMAATSTDQGAEP